MTKNELPLFELTHTLYIEGRDVWGRRSLLVLQPSGTRDWVWDVHGRDIPITSNIMQWRARHVALECEGEVLHEFEHLGILRAIGVMNVRVRMLSRHGWPPFDGCSAYLWKQVRPFIEQVGVRKPCVLNAASVQAGDRSVTYDPMPTEALTLEAYIDYARRGHDHIIYTHPCGTLGDLLQHLVSARTLGLPHWARYPLGLLPSVMWPHYSRIVWLDKGGAGLREVAEHRLLDMLAICNFAAPPGTYLTGHLESRKGGHWHDVELVKRMANRKVVPLRSKAAA